MREPPTSRSAAGLAGALLCLLAFLALTRATHAEPWIAPGDLALRHDLQLLSDNGVLSTPINTWPLSWASIARAVMNPPRDIELTVVEQAALRRVQSRARRAMAQAPELTLRAAVQERPRVVRSFEYTPREEGELQAGWAWTGKRFAASLQATVVADPDDGDTLRLDGSYVGAALGNWMLSVGQMDRWWGPGWNGSLILGSNARPVLAVSLDRNYHDAFEVPVLRWLGPWSLNTFMGQLEEDREIPNALLFGLRLGFRPTQNFEFSLARTAQWCGDGRPCDLATFGRLLIGNDNRGDDLSAEEEPGNQLAGLDFRWNVGGAAIPAAVYGQLIGEDEAGGLPSRLVGMVGAEHWRDWGRRSVRLFGELTDTAAGVLDEQIPDYTYWHFLYRTGYRYKGRSMGHSSDNDALMVSFGGIVTDERGRQWSGLVQAAELNRVGVRTNPVAATATDYFNAEVVHERPLGNGFLRVSLGYERFDVQAGGSDGGVKGFLQWQWRR